MDFAFYLYIFYDLHACRVLLRPIMVVTARCPMLCNTPQTPRYVMNWNAESIDHSSRKSGPLNSQLRGRIGFPSQ